MADNTVALGIKVPDAMASLGSVMGAANAMQSFKSGAVDLEKKRATLQSDIERNAAETSRAKTAAEGEGADLTEKQAFRALGKNGFKEYMGQDGQMDFNKLLPAVMQAAPTKGAEFISHIYGAHTAALGAQQALLGLDNAKRTTVAEVVNSLGDKKPEEARKMLDGLVQQMPEVKAAVDSAWKYHLEPASKDPAAFKKASQTIAQGVMSVPQQNEANTPNMVGVSSGGQTGLMQVPNKPMAPGFGGPATMVPGSVINQTPGPQIMNTPGGPGVFQPTTNSVTPVGGLNGAEPPNGGAPAPQAKWGGDVPLTYPVRAAGAPYTPGPSEATDLESGKNYRTSIVAQQQALPTAKRNIEETIKGATALAGGPEWWTGGLVGSARRAINNAVGSPEYKELSKNLANAQISMIQAGGGSMSTDAGKHLVAMANGDETYPPKVLIDIARRTGADITNADMQATAAQKFSQQYGDNNMNAFKLAWNKNADTKVFEAMNIYNSSSDKAKVKPIIDQLFGNDPKQRAEYLKKYQNIQKLYSTGSL